MKVIDETGRLFGRVNVYDALAVLAVLAAVGAGVAYADPLGGDGGDPATRYVTLDLGDQPPSTAARIAAGDRSVDEGSVTVTDAYVGPARDGATSVVIRARVNGTVEAGGGRSAGVFQYADAPLHRGDNLTVETAAYEATGRVLAVDAGDPTLETGRLPVLVETTLSPATAAHVDRGDEYRIDGRAVATVTESVVLAPGNRTNRTAFLGLSLRTVRHSGNAYYGDTQVLVDRPVTVRTDRYALSGTVTRVGTDALPGDPTNATAVVKLENVDPDVADGLEAGLVERRDGTTIATVTDVRTEPASVVLTSDDGDVHQRTHPRNLDVALTVELRVRDTESGLRFRARPLREGADLRLDLGTVLVDGTVIDVER